MSRALCLLFCLCSLAFAKTPNPGSNHASSPSSSVEVLYVLDNSTITTYNIDQQTFEPTSVGTTAMPQYKYPRLVVSPNGEFLYYLANSSFYNENLKIYVYDTDASGVPGNTPVQSMSAGQLLGIAINPTSTFFYSVAVGTPGQQYMTPYSIVRNVIDPTTGSLSQPVTEATYQLDSDTSGNDCYLSVLGFNPAGTTMYDAILCSGPHGSGSETFNQRSVDLQTGALGPDEQLYEFSSYAGSGYVEVEFANNLMFAFIGYFNQGPNANLVDVYQTQPFVNTPLVNCTTTMLTVCGDYESAVAHPSGNYVFLGDTANVTDIDAVNLSTQQIAQVNTLPFDVGELSPDGKVAYGKNSNSPNDVHIAGFNAANGEIKVGGSVKLPHLLYDGFVAAERY
jgi:hypothetical protein